MHVSREENAKLIQSLREMRITLSESAEQVLQARAWLKSFDHAA